MILSLKLTAILPEVVTGLPVIVKLPVTLTSPVIEPPVFAFNELFALVKAPLAYDCVNVNVVAVVLAKVNAPFAKLLTVFHFQH